VVEPLPGLSFRQSKISPTVDHQGVGVQLRNDFTGSSMGQREEDHLVMCEHFRRCLGYHPIAQWSQMWMVLAQERSGTGTGRHGANLLLGMREQQPEQLSARIASGAGYRNPHSHSHEYAIVSNFMHFCVSGSGAR
jgi:hypothetical protein